MDPPQDTAEHISQDGGNSEKIYLRIGKHHRGEKGGEKQQSLKAEGEEVLQVPEQRSPCSPWKGPHWSMWIFPEGTASPGEPIQELYFLPLSS